MTHTVDIYKLTKVLRKYVSDSITSEILSKLYQEQAIHRVDTSELISAAVILRSELTLSDEEIKIFNAYIDSDLTNRDLEVAFGNNDWVDVYDKITRFNRTETVNKVISKWRKIREC